MNPLYEAYARAHGRTADAQLEQDKVDWTGCMIGFQLWISARKQEFRKLFPQHMQEPKHSLSAIADYDAWYAYVTDNEHPPLEPV